VSRAARVDQAAVGLRDEALWQHPPYFHDGSAATLVDVVDHHNRVLTVRLSAAQKHDFVEYLKSL